MTHTPAQQMAIIHLNVGCPPPNNPRRRPPSSSSSSSWQPAARSVQQQQCRLCSPAVEDMSTPAVSCLREALRRSFVTLQRQRCVWGSVLEDCSPLMDSLGNLAEQMSALSRLQLSDTPLRIFPDLQDRLRVKLLQDADTVLRRVRHKMTELQAVRDSISQQVSAVLQVYEQNSDSLDLSVVTERSAASPSLADMLEWLQDAERFYRRQFLQRKTLLQTLRLDHLHLLESAPRKWRSLDSPGSDQQTTDTLCRLAFFMESQNPGPT